MAFPERSPPTAHITSRIPTLAFSTLPSLAGHEFEYDVMPLVLHCNSIEFAMLFHSAYKRPQRNLIWVSTDRNGQDLGSHRPALRRARTCTGAFKT